MGFELSGLRIAPATAEAVQTARLGAVGIGPTVTDHQCLVSCVLVEIDVLESPTDHLVLVKTGIVLAGTVDAVDHGVQVEMLANRNALVLRLAAGNRQIVSVGTQFGELLRNTLVNRVVQAAGDFLSGIVRVVEHGLVGVILAVNPHAFVKLVIRNAVALHRFADGRSNETMQFGIVRHRISHLFERLDNAANDSWIGFRQCAIEVKQNDFLRMFGHGSDSPLGCVL